MAARKFGGENQNGAAQTPNALVEGAPLAWPIAELFVEELGRRIVESFDKPEPEPEPEPQESYRREPRRRSLREWAQSFFIREEDDYDNPLFFDPLGAYSASEESEEETPEEEAQAAENDSDTDKNGTDDEEPIAIRAIPTGDFRTMEEMVGAFEFLIVSDRPLSLKRVASEPFVIGPTRLTGRRLETRIDLERFAEPKNSHEKKGGVSRADSLLDLIRRDRLSTGERTMPKPKLICTLCRTEEEVTAALFHSSSPEHWRRLVERAKELGLTLDKNALCSVAGRETLDSERDLYERLGLPFIVPEFRNGRNEFVSAPTKPTELLTLEDIRGDMHLHTTFSDGTADPEAMATAAIARGYDYIALTDHSQRVFSARGMDERKIRQYWKRIDRLNEQLEKSGRRFRVLKGIEVDILGDGELDMSDDILARADWVVASLHFELDQPRDLLHHRLERALANPYVCVLGHPTGRILHSDFRPDLDPDFLLETVKRHDKFLEFNAQPRRLDPGWRLSRKAKELGIRLVLSTDSHGAREMDYLRYGVNLLRKAGLTKTDVLNAGSLAVIRAARTEILEKSEMKLFNGK